MQRKGVVGPDARTTNAVFIFGGESRNLSSSMMVAVLTVANAALLSASAEMQRDLESRAEAATAAVALAAMARLRELPTWRKDQRTNDDAILERRRAPEAARTLDASDATEIHHRGERRSVTFHSFLRAIPSCVHSIWWSISKRMR